VNAVDTTAIKLQTKSAVLLKQLFGDFFGKVVDIYAETGTIWLARCLYLSTYAIACVVL
jgi:hypothetical protein